MVVVVPSMVATTTLLLYCKNVVMVIFDVGGCGPSVVATTTLLLYCKDVVVVIVDGGDRLHPQWPPLV